MTDWPMISSVRSMSPITGAAASDRYASFPRSAGKKALPAVIAKLESKHLEVRLAAALMIGSHGQAAATAVPALTALLDDPSPELRTIVAQTLGQMGRAAQPAFAKLSAL